MIFAVSFLLQEHFLFNNNKEIYSNKLNRKKKFGGAGYRSRYLSHAKRALYHLSYAPSYYVYSIKTVIIDRLT